MSTTLDSKKKLALAIIDFLNSSLKDGTLQAEDGESVEVATSCIADVFHVDPSNDAHMKEAIGQQNLQQIYGVYEKLRQSQQSTSGNATTGGNLATGSTGTAKPSGSGKPTDESESLKKQGNAAMARKQYSEAIEFYTKAIAIAPTNPIYLSNRAAAYSAANKQTDAAADAEMAVAADPTYTKAWSRLGLARYVLGDARASMEAYSKGLEAEKAAGNSESDVMKRGYETAKKRVQEQESAGSGAGAGADDVDDASGASRTGAPGGMPDLSALAGMMGGGAGGANGAGGMPDFGAIMNNPMFRGMAENLMRNPDQLSSLMNNPQLRQMADQFGMGGGAGGGAGRGGAGAGGAGASAGAGGMPDFSSLMSDPNIAEMARNMMGGGGRGGGA